MLRTQSWGDAGAVNNRKEKWDRSERSSDMTLNFSCGLMSNRQWRRGAQTWERI